MSETPTGVRGHAPLLGEQTEEILTAVLGYNNEQIKSLYAQEVVYHEPAVDRLKESNK